MNDQETAPETPRTVTPRLVFYHANARNTGAAARFELKIAPTGNCLFLEMARQKTAGGTTERGRAPGTFDWENKVTVKLGFSDVCELTAVLDGLQEEAGTPGRGLYHDSGAASTMIGFRREKERPGYLLGVSKKPKAGDQTSKVQILFSPPEALGIRHVLRGCLFHLAFGAA